MRYWWVNQNKTYRHELDGGYLWSPKRNANNRRNPFYEFMREVSPGDLVFSFSDTYIKAIGVAASFCRENPRPGEFGRTGMNWSDIGWKVDVRWRELNGRVRPKDHMAALAAHLPVRYSPLTAAGNGLQNIYLTEIPRPFANALFGIVGREVKEIEDIAARVEVVGRVSPGPDPDTKDWEDREENQISLDSNISETEKRALVLARRGQGRSRLNLRKIEKACRVTKVDRLEHLIASHAKPWRRCSNSERLDGENGLLLTPTIDHLFNDGFISFENGGQLIISDLADTTSLKRMGVNCGRTINVGAFSEGQRRYLEFHRDNVLLVAKVRR
jgi:putative restriction endonuclease